MLQAADAVVGVIRACAEDCLFANWTRLPDLRTTFEVLVVEGAQGEVPHFMLSQPTFEQLIHPELARAATARASLGCAPADDCW